MKWKNLSKTSCVMIVMFSFLFFYGIVPLLFFDNGTTDTKNLREMSKLVHRLEKEKSELLSRIALLEPKGTADTLSSQNQIVDQLEQNNPESEQFIKPAEVVRGDNQLFPKPITYNTGNVQSSESVLVVGGTGTIFNLNYFYFHFNSHRKSSFLFLLFGCKIRRYFLIFLFCNEIALC